MVERLATYYVTLKPVREGANPADGLRNIAYVSDPAVEEVGIYLNEHDPRIVADEQTQKAILEYLKGVGCKKPENWKEVSEDEYLSGVSLELSNDPASVESFNDVTKKDGSGQWLVRYVYTGPRDEKNRDFCAEVLDLDFIYTEEQIKNGLSNPEFGNYSIWDYKGSYGCRHTWKRQIYFEDFEDGEVRKVGNVPTVTAGLDDREATTLNAYLSRDEKMQVCAPLLIPEKDIFRNDEIGRYNMRFSKDTIYELRDVAMSRDLFSKSDLFKDTHEGGAAPSYVLEQWITETPEDKAYTEYGFDIKRNPIGTWFVLSQVTDKDFWEKEIKGNKKHAYSIEALMNLTIVEMSKHNNLTNIKMENNQIVLPDGEHLINGTIYVVENGVVVATKEVTPEQEQVIEEVATEQMSETPATEEPETMAETVETPTEEMAETPEATTEAPATEEPSDDRLAQLEKAQEELLSEVAKLKAEMEKPEETQVEVAMSDNRPMWKRISDGINSLKRNN